MWFLLITLSLAYYTKKKYYNNTALLLAPKHDKVCLACSFT